MEIVVLFRKGKFNSTTVGGQGSQTNILMLDDMCLHKHTRVYLNIFNWHNMYVVVCKKDF